MQVLSERERKGIPEGFSRMSPSMWSYNKPTPSKLAFSISLFEEQGWRAQLNIEWEEGSARFFTTKRRVPEQALRALRNIIAMRRKELHILEKELSPLLAKKRKSPVSSKATV